MTMNPRYVEELRVGGGAADPVDGGIDLQSNGDIRSTGSLTVAGMGSLGGLAVSGGIAVGGEDGLDHSVAVSTPSGHEAAVKLQQVGGGNGGVLRYEGTSGTVRLGSRSDSSGVVDAVVIAKGNPDVSFLGNIALRGNLTGSGGLRLDAGTGAFVLDFSRLGGQLVVNGEVEGAYVGGLAPNWVKASSGVTCSAETISPYAGTKSQRVLAQADKFVGSTALAVTAGKCYVLSYAVRTVSGTGLSVRLYQSGALDQRLRVGVSAASWTLFSDVFRCTSTASAVQVQFWNNGSTDAEWCFDAVSLREVTDGELLVAGKTGTSPSNSSRASLSIPQGIAPTTPADGDVWMTSGGLHVRTNGSTLGPLIDAGHIPWNTPGQIGASTPNTGVFSALSVSGNATVSGDLAVNGGDLTSSSSMILSAGGRLSLQSGGTNEDVCVRPTGTGKLTVQPATSTWPQIGGYNPSLLSNYSGTTFFGTMGNSAGTPTEYGQMTIGIHDNTVEAEKGYFVFRVMDKPGCGGLRDNAFLVTSSGVVSHASIETGNGVVRGSWDFPLQLIAQGSSSDVVLTPGGSGRVTTSADVLGKSLSVGTDGSVVGSVTINGGTSTSGGRLRIRKGAAATGTTEYAITTSATGAMLVNDGTDDILVVDGGSNRVGVMTATPGEVLDVSGQLRAGRNASILLTNDGGYAVKLVAGETLAKGDLVTVSSTAAGRVAKTPADADEPVGVVYSDLNGGTSGISAGSYLWVVTSGLAKVTVDTTVSLGNWLRTSLSGGTAGRAATGTKDATTHWKEIGHALESGAAGNQVLAMLNFL